MLPSLFALSVLAVSQAPTPKAGAPVVLPARWAADRFFVEPLTTDGKRLSLYTDTGGGLFLTEGATQRLGLAVEDGKPPSVRLPPFVPGAWIPGVGESGDRLPVMPKSARQPPGINLGDGILGQTWLAGHCWTFDYPGRKLLLRAEGDLPAVEHAHRVTLGFPVGGDGTRQTNFPRIQAIVDGETLDLLLDTGATTALLPEAVKALGDGGPAERATSFITSSTFARWRSRNAEWRVVEKAETGTDQPMIEVPSLEVGGYSAGPVWFTRRPDPNFHEFMSQWMDRRVEGALGGNALRTFRVTVDYPSAIAAFERPGR